MKNVVILGSTGSIGQNTLEVLRHLGSGYRVYGLAARSSLEKLAQQAAEFRPVKIALPNPQLLPGLRKLLPGNSVEFLSGAGALTNLAEDPDVDIVVNALVGGIGLRATLTALQNGKTVALANKESIVMAGRLVMEAVARYGGQLLPIDSEHSAIHQCLRGENTQHIKRLILTASGGPFLRRVSGNFQNVTPQEALQHPNWQMGPKITVDSATLMNKGLEIIEAHYLFNLPPEKIQVVIHPQSVIHSLVEFVDGSLKAQLSRPDMRLPIHYALTYPERTPAQFVTTNLVEIGTLAFEKPDYDRFPCLKLAYKALESGEGYPAVLSAANEVAVAAFLAGQLPFDHIPVAISRTMEAYHPTSTLDLATVLETDNWAHRWCQSYIEKER